MNSPAQTSYGTLVRFSDTGHFWNGWRLHFIADSYYRYKIRCADRTFAVPALPAPAALAPPWQRLLWLPARVFPACHFAAFYPMSVTLFFSHSYIFLPACSSVPSVFSCHALCMCILMPVLSVFCISYT